MAKTWKSEAGAAGAAKQGASFWDRAIEEWSASGLTQVEFCRRRGLALASLRWWKWRLKAGAAGDQRSPAESGPTKARRQSAPATPRFLPVRLLPDPKQATADAAVAEPGSVYELELAGGHRIRVPADFQPEVLYRLILTVEATRC